MQVSKRQARRVKGSDCELASIDRDSYVSQYPAFETAATARSKWCCSEIGLGTACMRLCFEARWFTGAHQL